MLSHREIYESKESLICLPNLGRATYWSFDIKSIAKMRRKRRYVQNIRSDTCYMLVPSGNESLSPFILYQTTKT